MSKIYPKDWEAPETETVELPTKEVLVKLAHTLLKAPMYPHELAGDLEKAYLEKGVHLPSALLTEVVKQVQVDVMPEPEVVEEPELVEKEEIVREPLPADAPELQ